jgi:hypothetical protein
MASDAARERRAYVAVAFVLICGAAAPVAAETSAARTSYTCVVAGKKVISDRLIPECANIEQRELNPDGSLRRIVKPTPTNDEREEMERREREEKAKVAALNDAIRRDRNLMQRFPDEAAHRKAREKALDDVRLSAKNSGARIELLLEERKTLDEERKFYENERVRKPLPSALKQKIDANDAGLDAQRSLAQNAQNERERINALYDAELLRLRKLWAGAPAGSLGPLPAARTPAATPAAAPSIAKTAPAS